LISLDIIDADITDISKPRIKLYASMNVPELWATQLNDESRDHSVRKPRSAAIYLED